MSGDVHDYLGQRVHREITCCHDALSRVTPRPHLARVAQESRRESAQALVAAKALKQVHFHLHEIGANWLQIKKHVPGGIGTSRTTELFANYFGRRCHIHNICNVTVRVVV